MMPERCGSCKNDRFFGVLWIAVNLKAGLVTYKDNLLKPCNRCMTAVQGTGYFGFKESLEYDWPVYSKQ